jgi:hypothetical protein
VGIPVLPYGSAQSDPASPHVARHRAALCLQDIRNFFKAAGKPGALL